MLIDLCHLTLNLICLQAWLIPCVCGFSFEWHLSLHTIHSVERVQVVDSDTALFSANSGRGHHCTQSCCGWLTNTLGYCSIPSFSQLVCPSVRGLNDVHSCESTPSWRSIRPQKFKANSGHWSEIIVFGRPSSWSYFLMEQFRQSYRIYCSMRWDNMSYHWQHIHHHLDCIPRFTLWEPNTKIHWIIRPWFLGYRKRLEDSNSCLSHGPGGLEMMAIAHVPV